MAGVTSTTLLDGLAEGDDAAWKRFEMIYGDWMRAKIWRTLPAHGGALHAVDDVAQEVRLKLSQKVGGFVRQREGSFRKWMEKVIFTTSIDLQKRGGNPAAVEQAMGSRADQVTAHTRDDSEALPEDVQLLKRAMDTVRNRVSEVQWRAFEQYKLLGHRAIEVARELGIARTVVHRHAEKVLGIIRDLLMEPASSTDA